jgi:hypothetical protein
VARNIDRSEQTATELQSKLHFSSGTLNFCVADPKQFDYNFKSGFGLRRFRVSNPDPTK